MMGEEAKVQHVLDNGQECSRAEFIRQEFLKGKSRGELAKELDVSYNIVFSATANMFNEKHPEGGKGGGGGRSVMVAHPETGETMPRAQVMKDLFGKGWTRSEIAKQFEVPYATVYGATKDVEAPEGSKATHGGKVMIAHPETGESVARIDYIRESFAEGKTRRDIANEIGCDYSVVWMATREAKDDADAEGADAEAAATSEDEAEAYGEETPDLETEEEL